MKPVTYTKGLTLIHYYKISIFHYKNLNTMRLLIEKISKLFGGSEEHKMPIPHKEKERYKLEKLKYDTIKYTMIF